MKSRKYAIRLKTIIALTLNKIAPACIFAIIGIVFVIVSSNTTNPKMTEKIKIIVDLIFFVFLLLPNFTRPIRGTVINFFPAKNMLGQKIKHNLIVPGRRFLLKKG